MAKRKGSSSASTKKSKIEHKSASEDNPLVEEPLLPNQPTSSSSRSTSGDTDVKSVDDQTPESKFVGEPIPDEVARNRWPHRYQGKGKGAATNPKTKDETEENYQARRHFDKAEIDGSFIFNLGDDAHVMAGEGEDPFICRVVEMFEGEDGSSYFTAQWFYRARDTVIKDCGNLIDNKRVFLSEVKNDNKLDCLIEKLKIIRLPLNADIDTKNAALTDCHYYYDMMYLLPYSSFVEIPLDDVEGGTQSDSTISTDDDDVAVSSQQRTTIKESKRSEMTLLDLYSGCGGMSTGLCLGANISGVNLVTKWTVDFNSYACDSLKLNHPETEVRNEKAEDFLALLKEWEKLCASYSLVGDNPELQHEHDQSTEDEGDNADEANDDGGLEDGEFEVDQIMSIRYCAPKQNDRSGVQLKVSWKGYGPGEDTWEPIEGLGGCAAKIKEFVTSGYNSKLLPLPGDVDVVCGGPPCQGISGFNRFRNKNNPLEDPKNEQLLVYMNVIEYLRPKFVLMENVVDILKFAGGFLGRYGLGRLVGMNYQARMGMMAAGAYGLPQFRMRMFMWGACHSEKLPQYPLPTHNVVVRGVTPLEFELNVVGYEEGHNRLELEKELFLKDAIFDLPPVENNESRDEMPYVDEPETEFQKFIRLRKDEMPGFLAPGFEPSAHDIYDHRPLELNQDDYQRVCQIPKRKGANYRDLKGVRVGKNNKAELDPNVERVYLPSKKPLVPNYALTFVNGISTKPFGRLWWDETVPTVVTRAEPHNQAILHPLQDRVLTVRENARLQGFPDYYKLLGPIKERYTQVGNAVAVPVARALGYSLGLASKGLCNEGPLLSLPKNFPKILEQTDVEEII